MLATVKDKIRSIHDELDDPRFPKEELEKKVGIAEQPNVIICFFNLAGTIDILWS